MRSGLSLVPPSLRRSRGAVSGGVVHAVAARARPCGPRVYGHGPGRLSGHGVPCADSVGRVAGIFKMEARRSAGRSRGARGALQVHRLALSSGSGRYRATVLFGCGAAWAAKTGGSCPGARRDLRLRGTRGCAGYLGRIFVLIREGSRMEHQAARSGVLRWPPGRAVPQPERPPQLPVGPLQSHRLVVLLPGRAGQDADRVPGLIGSRNIHLLQEVLDRGVPPAFGILSWNPASSHDRPGGHWGAHILPVYIGFSILAAVGLDRLARAQNRKLG